ncbi:MAG: nonstructural protein [Microvirus sp.]|nr:MAG: nonstructural protein [Microvirus sp.]
MAKTKVFTVYDSKIGLYNTPFHLLSTGEALRGWAEIVNDPESKICKYPEDFTLFELGEYDQETGRFHNLNTPLSLGLAVQAKYKPTTDAPLLAGIKEGN